ncbi:MAG: hypothetical protein V4557_10670 [Bacteroidota bacterium]
MENDKLNINQVTKNTDPDSPLNFDSLRAKAIELVQGFSGHVWSDFNLHDPGVTILEHLSYAITDMAYRTHFDIKDLLTDINGNINTAKNLFYSRRDIFASNPVTVNDLRKLVLDSIPDVYNVWFEKIYSNQSSGYIKGLYKVTIQLFDEDPETLDPEITEAELNARRVTLEEDTIARVRNVVLDHRNLGEDYVDFSILKPCVIEVEADIVIDRHVHPEEILAEVYAAIQHTLNPPIHFYSEMELFAKGFTLEEMYSGPALKHGFLLDAELDAGIKSMDQADLKKSTRSRIVDPSDILKSVALIPGVLYVRDFNVKANGEYRQIPFRLRSDEYASFSFVKEERDIKLSTENNEIQVRESLFYSILNKKSDFSKRKFIKGLQQAESNPVLKGVYQDVGHYFSIQHLFPPVYGLNIDKIDAEASPGALPDERLVLAKAKAKQLKAYLMFFEQLMANYVSQLASIDQLLTADIPPDSRTYFTQPLYEVPGVGNILKDFYSEEDEQTEIYWEKFKANPNNGYMSFLKTQIETDEIFKMRKNRVLDHLMSRFNLNLKKYPVIFFSQLFHPEQADERISAELTWKSDFLKDVVGLSRNRNRAYNYRSAGATEASGFEVLMSRLLYIQDTTKRRLGNILDEYQSRFSLQERDFYVAKSHKPMTTVPVEWAKGTKMELLISEDELNQLLNEPVAEKREKEEAKGLLFHKQSISFLKDGLDIKNYRIGPEINNSGFILIYKSPADDKWIRAGIFDNWQSASDALSFLLNTLRQFNIQSEGFHVVEHILLRPSLKSKYFGFNFYDEKGHVLFYHNHWTDFQEREEALESILAIADQKDNIDDATVADILNGKCRINHWQNDKLVKSYGARTLYQSDPVLAKKLFDKMIRNIRSFRKKRMTLYPGIENMVNRLHDADIREDFFHFRMTVVLPAWPTRFQDKGFRVFTESLFREYTPAHIKLQFKWLNLGKMKKFEDLFFDWRESMQRDHQTADDIVKSDKLISFINEGIYSMM